MSQELQVVQCYSCETFQTQIVKKANKWVCKSCGEKQSLKKVFGQGSGKDCRIHCQRLNALRAKKEEESKENSLRIHELGTCPTQAEIQGGTNMSSQSGSSRWSKYLSQPSSSDADEEEEEVNWSDIRPSQFYIPKSPPESFEIPCAKKYKNNSGQQITSCKELLMDSEDECFDIDVPEDDAVLTKDVGNIVNIGREKENISKKENSACKVPKSNFALDLVDLLEEDTENDDACAINPLLPSVMQESIKNGVISTNTNLKLNRSSENAVFDVQSKVNCNGIFKMVPSDNLVVEQLKKRISLLEDIDKYTIDELTDMCKI